MNTLITNRRYQTLSALIFPIIALALIGGPAEAGAKRATVTPGPTAKNASIFSEISFRGVKRSKAGKIVVRGNRTGRHGYSRRAHSDRRGFSLVMKKPFRESERITVRTRLAIPGARKGDYRFKVENLGASRVKRLGNAPLDDAGPVQFKSRPDLRPFSMDVRKTTDAAGDDPIFVGSKQRGNAIFSADGSPIWFRPMRSTDFRMQKYRGKPALTWTQQPTKGSGTNRATYAIANSAYKVIRRFTPGNGYSGDSHEFRLTKRGTAFITTYRTVRRDLRSIGFDKNGRVSDSIAQEVDLRTGRVIWEWHSLDHVPVRHSYADGPRRPGNPYDYFHINSIIDTPDGNVMVSGRSTNAIYKISRRSGRIIWTLGGRKSDYKFGRGALFSWQHDAQPRSGNRVSLFDNSDAPVAAKPWAEQSRGLVLKLNNKSKKATVDRQFYHPVKPLSPTQANLQFLKGGDYFVGWGQFPLISEYNGKGGLIFDAYIQRASSFYRAYRQPWTGRPGGRPAIATDASGSTAYAWVSWNGDTRVAKWRALTGPSAGKLKATVTRNRSGFETRIALPAGAAFTRIQGLNAGGKVIGATKVTRIG